MKRLMISALLAALIAGCSSTPDLGAEQTGAPVEGRMGGSDSGANVTTVTAGNVTAQQLPAILSDPKSILSSRSIYFDYDSNEIKPRFRDLVTAHARFLTENRQFKILLQGHTDERGSREYNLALGQKRAETVKKAMMLLGVREDQIESVSMGEEKPKELGHDETAYAQNRRADILYVGEY